MTVFSWLLWGALVAWFLWALWHDNGQEER